MTRLIQRTIVLGLLVTLGGVAPGAAWAEPATKRSMEEIVQDYSAIQKQLEPVLGSTDTIVDDAKRKEAAPKAIPPLKKMLPLLDELADAGEPQAKPQSDQIRMMLALFGDAESKEKIDKAAGSKDAAEALVGKSSQLVIKWVQAHKDPEAQAKLLEEAQKLAKDNEHSDALTGTLLTLNRLGPATRPLARRARDAAIAMKSRLAGQVREQLAVPQKLRDLEGKPLTVSGALPGGKPFSTKDWKGKVILVDFWATWCAPCREELPRVKKVYQDLHAKGLEVVGVSSDNNADDLNKFLSDNKDVSWPQLFDPGTHELHPLLEEYGVRVLPTMFLIDRKGIVRSVQAQEDYEELIPKLLAEKE